MMKLRPSFQLVVAEKRYPDAHPRRSVGKGQEDPGYMGKIEYIPFRCTIAAVRVAEGGRERERCLYFVLLVR